jgi:hypothetical protein
VISTDITSSAIDRTVGRTVLGTPVESVVCFGTASGMASGMGTGTVSAKTFVDYRITAELRASSFVGAHAWLRPAALDVPTTQGPLVWRPPT